MVKVFPSIALFQNMVYTQFLDALLGPSNNVTLDQSETEIHHQNFYDSKVDGSIKMVFSTAAFRLHTLISNKFVLRDEHYRTVNR